jgi:hypothetical protein
MKESGVNDSLIIKLSLSTMKRKYKFNVAAITLKPSQCEEQGKLLNRCIWDAEPMCQMAQRLNALVKSSIASEFGAFQWFQGDC